MSDNGRTPELTALQLWNHRLREELEQALFTSRFKTYVIPIRLAIKRTQKAVQVAEHFEVTKHRALVDALIRKLDNSKAAIDGFTGELNKRPWWMFKRRAHLRKRINTFLDMQFAYQAALLIVVNTPPPAPTHEN